MKKKGQLDIKRFIVRRGFKIWPVYYVYITFFLLVRPLSEKTLGESYMSRLYFLLGEHWPNFLHIQNYFPSTHRMGWLWSLSVEEHFYLVIPFVVAWTLKRKKKVSESFSLQKAFFCLLGLVGGCLFFRAMTMQGSYTSSPMYILVFPSHLRVDALASGVFLAFFETFYPKKHKAGLRLKTPLFLVGILLVSTPWFFKGEHQLFLYPFGLTILTLGFSLIVYSVSDNKTRINELSNIGQGSVKKWTNGIFLVLAFIGIRSYSIYVWHGYMAKPIANRLSQLLHLDPSHTWLGGLQEIIYLLVPLGLGVLSFSLIEEPFLKIRERFTKTQTIL